MSIRYLIAHKVIYIPRMHTLKSAKGDLYPLAVSASLCLKVLLEGHGNTVTKPDLIEQVWRTRGMNVSHGTIYQNISLLRKSIEAAGGGVDIIKTLSKEGFSIPPSVSVICESDEDLLISMINKEGGYEEPTETRRINQNNHTSENIKNSISSCIKKMQTVKLTLLVTALIVTNIVLNFREIFHVFQESYYDDYIKVNSEIYKNCHVFANGDAEDNTKHIRSLALINVNCKVYPFIYITSFNMIPSVSLVACNKKIHKKYDTPLHCSSYFLRGVE